MMWFKPKKTKDPRCNHVFTEEDMELSKEIRKTRSDLRKIQGEIKVLAEKQKLEEARLELRKYKEDYYGSDSDSNEDPFEQMLMSMMMGGLNNNSPLGANKPTDSQTRLVSPKEQGVDLTDEEIDQLLSGLPKALLKKAKKFDDQLIEKMVRMQLPYITKDSLTKIIEKIKS